MSERIIEQKRREHYYYYYRVSFREKIKSGQQGKVRGTGKSKVVTDDTYLGKAKDIYEKVKGRKEEPVYVFEHGLESALVNIAGRIGLLDILDELLPSKKISGVSISKYIFTGIVNRICDVKSKMAMHLWLRNSSFKLMMRLPLKSINSQTFWKAFDEIIPQREVYVKQQAVRGKISKDEDRKTRKERKFTIEEIESLLDDDAILRIEEKLYFNIIENFKLKSHVFYYDTTNFFNYYWKSVSELSKRGNNKKKRNDKRQVGVASCVVSPYGIPIFSMPYGGNVHDAKVFKHVIGKIENRFLKFEKQLNPENRKLVFVCDKGNNSKGNIGVFDQEHGKIAVVVGALSPYAHQDLCEIQLADLDREHLDFSYTTVKKECYGKERAVVVAYDDALYTEQLNTFDNDMRDAVIEIEEEVRKYNEKQKRKNKGGKKVIWKDFKKRMDGIPAKYKVKGCLGINLTKAGKTAKLTVDKKDGEIKKKKNRMGKLFFFANDENLKATEIIDYYRGKYIVEDIFKALNDKKISPFSPVWHWTDSKVRIHSFICVLAVTLVRLLEIEAKKGGVDLSAKLLLEELRAVKLCIMGNNVNSPKKQLNVLSPTQEALVRQFDIIPDFCCHNR